VAEYALRLVGMPENEEREFRAIAEGLRMSAIDLLSLLARRVVECDRSMRHYDIKGIAFWRTEAEREREVSDIALGCLPIDVKESWCMWPADKVFPWSAMEYKEAVLGYEVRWPLGLDEFNLIRGKWELIDGYASLYQPG
jgi:hypothetical protein